MVGNDDAVDRAGFDTQGGVGCRGPGDDPMVAIF